MRSDNKALSAVSDALGLGAAKVDTAYSAMDSAIDIVSEIKAKIVAATEKGVEKTKIQDEIGQLQQQLLSVAQSASFSGENWVAGNTTKSVVSSFVRDANGQVSVQTTSMCSMTSTSGNVLFGVTTTGAIDTSTGIIGTSSGSVGSIYSMDITSFGSSDIDLCADDRRIRPQCPDKGGLAARLDLDPHRPAGKLRFQPQRFDRLGYRAPC